MDLNNLRLTIGNACSEVPIPFLVGIPFPKGYLKPKQIFSLEDIDNGTLTPLQTAPLSYWPDNSVRWLKICFLVKPDPLERKQYILSRAPSETQFPTISTSEYNDGIEVDNGKHRFRFSNATPGWCQYKRKENGNSEESSLDWSLKDSNGQRGIAKLTSHWTIKEKGPACVTLKTEGEWRQTEGTHLANFSCTVEIYQDSDTVVAEFCIHNPNRARHPGGLWDLGDPGSIYFTSLGASVTLSKPAKSWIKPQADDGALYSESPLRLYQDSSGGEHWDSRNHIDANGDLTVSFRGYRVSTSNQQVAEGQRATPIAGLETETSGVQACLKDFWQNFPSALGVDSNRLDIAFFPEEQKKAYELQGGERKSQRLYLHYGKGTDCLNWVFNAPIVTIPASVYEKANAFPWFNAKKENGPLDALINQSIEGPNNFFAKREVIDEYGWRNFGDLFADHESLYRKEGEPPFISHYNNQYDPIYGFARQFALTGDQRWFELMNDLANHVVDIDIYHTNDDRTEYNNGLFWHTDHYLDAKTCTHRTFTALNNSSSTPGQLGGGPAAEHCYTSGHLYHYWMTGAEASREAVLELAQWMVNTHEGRGGLLEQLLFIKKYELPKAKALAKGQKSGFHTYPFTRGTGNYLNALLDAWSLTGDTYWQKRAEFVIANSIHKDDKPDDRDLLNVETGWSYLVLLTSISKYIFQKIQFAQIDSELAFAIDSLKTYARWMVENERIFLSDPDALEFPNDTWTAQDIRKVSLLLVACNIDPDWAERYRARAMEWLKSAVGRLSISQEKHYTRILAVLLQNYTNGSNVERIALQLTKHESITNPATIPPRLTWSMLISRIFQRLVRGVITFRPSREIAWIQSRKNDL